MLGVPLLWVIDEEQSCTLYCFCSLGGDQHFCKSRRGLRRSWDNSYLVSTQKMPVGKSWSQISSGGSVDSAFTHGIIIIIIKKGPLNLATIISTWLKKVYCVYWNTQSNYKAQLSLYRPFNLQLSNFQACPAK